VLLVVGLLNAVAAVRVARDSESGHETAFFAGIALLGWIIGEMILLRIVNWMQLGYLAIAIATMFEAVRRRAAQVPPMPS
jgi:hypothetical protein